MYPLNNLVNSVELELLDLMYQNLARRSRTGKVSRETFEIFFHASGLIGEILFLKFDTDKNGIIGYEEFLQAF
jgi:hypothetical protein